MDFFLCKPSFDLENRCIGSCQGSRNTIPTYQECQKPWKGSAFFTASGATNVAQMIAIRVDAKPMTAAAVEAKLKAFRKVDDTRSGTPHECAVVT